jgi:DNA-binding MarR family transcriptional regulator
MPFTETSVLEDESKKATIKNIVWALRHIVTIIYHDSMEMARQYGVTGPQSLVIKCLHASEDPLSSAALSRLLNVTPANITGIIDRLEEKGLVGRTRKTDDRRIQLIGLTEQGREQARKLPDLIEEKLVRGMETLSSEEVGEIYKSIDTIIRIIEDTVSQQSVDADD